MLITDELTNKVYFSQRIKWYKCWKDMENALKGKGGEYALLHNTKDIWVRDFMPVQTDINRFLGYSYNPNYLEDIPELMSLHTMLYLEFNA